MRRVPIWIGRALIMGAWTVCVVAVVLTVAEIALAIRASVLHKTKSNWPTSRIGRLEMAYAPFTVQYLHPQYLFFFPLDPAERVALSNDAVHLDREGFRGPGPALAGSRQLAFLVGGSTVFGHYASSDDTTISGYLNRIQDKYLFVNAGVPSWNSSQEMFRVAFQLAAYRPSLVIAYDGANDAGLLTSVKGGHPVGTPESFGILAEYFDNLQGRPKGPARTPAYWFDRLLPQVSDRVNRLVLPAIFGPQAPEPERALPTELLEDGVSRYVENQRRMRDMVQGNGGRFVWVYQPVRRLHMHVEGAPFADASAQQRFHAALARRDLTGLEFHDLSSMFDRIFASVPLLEGDLTDSTIFVDEVHLYDPGNAIVARELWRVICAGMPTPRTACG